MPTIDLSKKVKEKLEKIKDEFGCKTFSEAVNIILIIYDEKKKKSAT